MENSQALDAVSPVRRAFTDLDSLRWSEAHRTYGNSHATLIGLFVCWWVALAKHHTALEGGPSYASMSRGTGPWGTCDALLCADDRAVGVLEVEGARKQYVIDKLGSFFRSTRPELSGLCFGMICFYSTSAQGRGGARQCPQAYDPGLHSSVEALSAQFPSKGVIITVAEKRYTRVTSGARKLSEYYFAELSCVQAVLYLAGREVESKVLFQVDGGGVQRHE